ncbi:MAG: response regulator [Actinobacteria bacterium]|nr:response regulator [Actinomycetota bacterium]
MDSDAVDATETTNVHRDVSYSRSSAMLLWAFLAAVAGLSASIGFDVRLALVVVIIARVLQGTTAGALALMSGAITTFLARGVILSSDPDVPTAVVSAAFLIIEAVALSHLVMLLAHRGARRERPVHRFFVFCGTLVAASLLLALLEWLVADLALDGSTTSFWERGAAVIVASLLGLCVSGLVRGRWFRYGGLAFDELTAPLAALVVVVLGLQATGEVWRSADQNRLSVGARTTMTAFLDAVTAEVNTVVRTVDDVDVQPSMGGEFSESVVALVFRGDGEDESIVVGDSELIDDVQAALSGSTRASVDGDSGTRLLSDGTIRANDQNLLVFEIDPDSDAATTSFMLVLDADLVLENASRTLAGTYGDVDFRLGASADSVGATGIIATGIIDGAELALTARPADGFGIDAERAALILLLEIVLGAAVVGVLLIGASSQVRVALERRRRESLLEAALDATPGVSVVFDGDMNVLAGNRAVRDAFADRIPGVPVIEVLGFGPETVRARIAIEILSKALGGEFGHSEVSGGEGEEMRILELEAYPVSVPGDERVGFLHVSDATERRNLAMRTAQAERMESLGALAGGLAHDFNNLLFVTLGNLQLMAMNETITKDEKLAKFLSRSMAAVERGAEITKSLLAVARSQPLEETAVSLADLIKGLLPLVKQAVGAGRTVEVDIPDPNLHLMVDAGRLQSCILNLAFNSRDAMGPTGHIRIAAQRRDDVIELSVSDDGAGMPPDVVARAFEPFFTTKKAGSGTGLGLATVYAFAQQSGGTARLESRPGAGTTVTLVLPLHVPGAVSERVSSTRRAGRRVVVADDEQALAEMVAAWLMDVGIDARFALSPREALELISEFHPDVLVSDANFGEEQDGLDLARLATADQPDLAVIFMTGYSSSMKQLQELGERTLAKPFSREDLYGAVLPLVADVNQSVESEEGGDGHGR